MHLSPAVGEWGRSRIWNIGRMRKLQWSRSLLWRRSSRGESPMEQWSTFWSGKAFLSKRPGQAKHRACEEKGCLAGICTLVLKRWRVPCIIKYRRVDHSMLRGLGVRPPAIWKNWVKYAWSRWRVKRKDLRNARYITWDAATDTHTALQTSTVHISYGFMSW